MKKALLIIDMQEGFRYPETQSLVPNITKLIKLFKQNIIFAKFINKKDSQFEKQLGWKKLQKSSEQKIVSELYYPNAKEFEHSTYTVLNSELKKWLIENKTEEVFLCGIYTDVCILKTAMDLFDDNFTTFVVEDACTSLHGQKNHDAAIGSLKHILGKRYIVSVSEIE